MAQRITPSQGTQQVIIGNVATPSADSDATNKEYVDDRVVANPSGSDGSNLTRVSIGGTNYNISGSGGGGGSFDLHDDVTTQTSVLADDDRMVIADESESGDPNRYIEASQIWHDVSKPRADSLYEGKLPDADMIVSSIPADAINTGNTGATTGTVRSSTNINSTNPLWGFYDNTSFGSFPTLTETFTTGVPSSWSGYFTGTYRYLAINTGNALTTAIVTAIATGQISGNDVFLVAHSSSTQQAAWRIGSGGAAEGRMMYLGHHIGAPDISIGTPGNSTKWTLSMDSSGGFETIVELHSNDVVLRGDRTFGQVGTGQLEDNSVSLAKLGSDLTTPNLGLSQHTDQSLRLSPAFVDAASELALTTRYQYDTTIISAVNNIPGNFIMANVEQNFDTNNLATNAPTTWAALRSLVLADDDNSTPSRSIEGLARYFGPGSTLEVRVLNSDGTRTGAYGVYGISGFKADYTGRALTAMNIPASYGPIANTTDDYGQAIYSGLIASSGTPVLTADTNYEIILHGDIKARPGNVILPGTLQTPAIADDAVSYGKMQDATAYTVLGNPSASNGTIGEIALTNNTVLGRNSSGAGSVQVNEAMMDIFNDPPSSGTQYLSYDGANSRMTWASVPGGSNIAVLEDGTSVDSTISTLNFTGFADISANLLGTTATVWSRDRGSYEANQDYPQGSVVAHNNKQFRKSSSGVLTNAPSVAAGTDLGSTDWTTVVGNTFTSDAAGYVPASGDHMVPDWDVINASTTLKSEHLAYDSSASTYVTRGIHIFHNGAIVTTLPTTWEAFAFNSASSSTDDAIRFDIDNWSSTVRNALNNDSTAANQTVTFVVFSDHNNWAIITYTEATDNASVFNFTALSGDGDVSMTSDRNGNNTRVIVVASKGQPQTTMQFAFPFNSSTGASISGGLAREASTADDVLFADGTFKQEVSVNLQDPKQLVTELNAEVADNRYYNSDGDISRLIKTLDYGDIVQQYTEVRNYNSDGDITTKQFYFGNFGESETVKSTHLVATETRSYNSSGDRTTTVIS